MLVFSLIIGYVLSFFAARWATLETDKKEGTNMSHYLVMYWFAPCINTVVAFMFGAPLLLDILDKERKFKKWLFQEGKNEQ
jgi:hypothetical protein